MIIWKKHLIKTNRGNFEVFITGKGTPVCVTHHYSEFNESGDHFAQSFADNHTVILVNLREAGNSAKAIEPYQLSMIEAVFDLEAIRKELGYDSWTFAGHSTGGMIGVLYGIHYSSSISSLLIVGSAAREYASSSMCIYNEGHAHFNRMQELIELLKLSTLSITEKMRLSRKRTQLSLFNPIKYDEYFDKEIHKTMSVRRMNFFNREVLIFDVTRQLSRITSNTIIVCGRYDVQCPVSFSIEMSELIPGASLYIMEESNHYPFLEEGIKFKQIVTAHLI